MMPNWNTNPWNRGKPKVPSASGLDPIFRKIIAARVHHGYSQQRFAEETGWSQSAISRYERGTDKVPFEYVRAAAKVLSMRLVLVGDDDE